MEQEKMKSTINVKGTEIEVVKREDIDYISLTDLAKYKDEFHTDDIIKNWLRNRNTIELLGIWEKLNNPSFKPVEFDGFRNQSGLNSFVMTPKKWIENTNAIGIISKSGRYGGTYAHKDIAFEFASWISVEFKLYIIKEFQRLKDEENNRLSLDWNLHRTLSKVNYRIHTDAIKENIIPPEISKAQESFIYANEADLLNVALYGKTASQWRKENPDKEGNIRDYSTIEQLLVLSNLESLNAEFIRMQIPMNQRLINLNRSAIAQMKSLLSLNQVKKLK
ncbi:MAG: KilA-N domain-containing protein [Candidatus Delongbacteria bacterium]|nr:KilA-N domain-containing protein [Candidatus Delongbacteria bacterium]